MTTRTKTLKAVRNVGPSDLVIERPRIMSIGIEIAGDSPLIQNNFGQKAIEQMLRKHMGLSVQREAKIPRECIENATVKNVDGVICVPPTAIKKAMLSAAAEIKGLKKTALRRAIFIVGGSIPITYSSMTPRMDMVRTSGIGRVPDVRFRPQLNDWKARLLIEYSDTILPQTVVDLLQRAGKGGIGEWRPEKDGTFGTFRVDRLVTDSAELSEIEVSCKPILQPLIIPSWAMEASLTPELLDKLGRSSTGEQEEDEEAEAV